jgi:hypothetical protein
MESGKDRCRFLPAVMLGLLGCGCCSWGTRQQQTPYDRAPAVSNPRRADPQPTAPLRIVEPARPATSATAVSPVDAPPSLGSAAVANPLGPAQPPAKGSDAPGLIASAGPSGSNSGLTSPRTTVGPSAPETLPPQPATEATGAVTTAPPGVPADIAPRTVLPPQHAAQNSQDPLRHLARLAGECYANLDCYQARFTRLEQINGKDFPREVMLFRFRKQPWSIYFKWIGSEHQGREMVYVPGQHEGKIHTLLANGDMFGMGAGMRWPVSPDSNMVRSQMRHPITEVGIGSLVQHFGRLVDAAERGELRTGLLTYLGPQARPEFPAPLETVLQTIPPGTENELPRGGRRWWFFAADSHLPVLLMTHDNKDREVEYYCYDSLQVPSVPFTDEDFNPDRLWPKR